MLAVDVLLENISDVLLNRILPKVDNEYMGSNIRTIVFLMDTALERINNETALKLKEIERIKKIFAMSLGVIENDDLKKKIASARDKKENSMMLQDINSLNHHLKGMLIELHAHVETLQNGKAKRIDGIIWNEISQTTTEKSASIIKLYMTHKALVED